MRTRILVVEDDKNIAETVRVYLDRAGYTVDIAHSGPDALAAARLNPPALVVLDLMLPGLGGLEVCKEIRKEPTVGIIMLTARAGEEDRLRGLDLGADDYVVKPFSPRELVARVRAVLRRSGQASAESAEIRVHDLSINLDRREVRRRGELIPLTPAEFSLLKTFARSPGRVFTRQDLVERAFGYDYDALDRTIDAHIMNLRRKLDPDRQSNSLILTVFGVGYRMNDVS